MTDLQETQHPSFRLPTNRDIPIWRYMDLAKYLSMLEKRALFFARATHLGDPFEGSPTKLIVARREYLRAHRTTDPALAAYRDIPESILDRIRDFPKEMVEKHLISSWHMNEHESAAMWKLYSSSQEAVSVLSTYRRLRMCLPKCVFIGEVNYINYATQLFDPNNTFNFVMHKRLSFEHERELRAVFCELDGTPEAQPYKTNIGPSGLAIEVDLSALIERVRVSPTAVPWFAKLVEAMTAKCGFKFTISQSSLADAPLF